MQRRQRVADLREAAQLARASTHPEQPARVEAIEKALLWYADPDHWLDGQAGEWIVEEGNHVSGDGFAHNEFEHDNGERARAALEPASPTPTEQGEARVEGRWICDGCGAKVLPAQIHDCPNTPPGRASSSTFRPAQTEQEGEGEAS